MDSRALTLAFIGFGEAGEAFASSLDRSGLADVRAFDVQSDGALTERLQRAQVIGCASLAEALNGADWVISVVTADQANAVAIEAAALLSTGALFFDCNSCAPQTKQRSAAAITAAGGRYVDVAVMAPVLPARNRTPLLISGEHCDSALDALNRLNLNASIQAGPVGKASSVKMVRSIMVKGLEALTAECVLAGRLAGVEDDVLASLNASHPGADWAQRSAYNFERMLNHGGRRAAEMTEVCHFLNELGMAEPLSERTVSWQRRLGELNLAEAANDDVRVTADALISALKLQPLTED
ncbi:hypothetical protein BGP77_15185 [Saccharospirillum sp. MSK14-1]|uniref:NAD(P)-dependent oxidoreductase n=1 Tax=Saccharospirillum sp. MSK14-1 TaxID=1897632 RepID=UPI000D37DB05|nr:NAD(P)-dependent oxidoreductase [Saccharospirillum sp. MSK14-1]PTY37817.1 hypothetical protein BGP77_15185 [Saccharospirillum sp. MSK14-1]